MTTVTAGTAITLDGFTAGTDQRLDAPMGDGIEGLHDWMFAQGEDNAAAIAFIGGKDAYVMGRNMFAPGRGEHDLEWEGWWGDEPPYAAPVFVLTHHEREPLVKGATTFHFVTAGFDAALALAVDAAGPDGSVGIAGGASTVRQALERGVVDQLLLSVAPIVAGAGERLFDGLSGLRFEPIDTRGTGRVSHLFYRVRPAPR